MVFVGFPIVPHSMKENVSIIFVLVPMDEFGLFGLLTWCSSQPSDTRFSLCSSSPTHDGVVDAQQSSR